VDEQRLPGLHAVLEDFISIDYDERFAFGIEQILRSASVRR
jgi:TetR/AcrR family tetracycline transcriptional repressor